MRDFYAALQAQRWDDHRYYHHSRINQSLHLLSALCFVGAYVLCFFDPASAALLAWGVAMTARQAGHFVFEPKGYDVVNQATHEHKEAIKVGYNLRRKVVLLAVWALSPAVLLVWPELLAVLSGGAPNGDLPRAVGLIWLAVGAGGLAFRTVQLCVTQDARTGLVWITKILTDPFHDIALYYKAPWYLLRGQLIDPMEHARESDPQAGDGAAIAR